MATNFPLALDAFTNPTATSNQNDPGVLHSDQHANANDAIEALQTKVGINNSTDPSSIDFILRSKQSAISFGAAPVSATAPGAAGDVVVSGGFIHICVATNTWLRAAVSTW